MTKMTELEEIVWTECVERLMPPDDETRQRWENDPFAMHQEHFRIRPLPPQHNKLLRAAHQEWVDEEHFALKRLGMTGDEFASRFSVLREGFLVSVINKFDGLIFRFGDGRLDKACKQNGICISTDAVGI